ncbi:PREDICTED: uncharacterized protein LOC108559969 [Nicrophorus vespilloides]|uniref:Uncharacterized protein LOC108559969 n=1 Tax=Nicrophorus vespilloides TaxID=110193 RepID=A0ABM1ME53_NICVS|nr:PREDICTED: uncharacterized protein LOC108559969 [Nicrophorus vespilloides]
MDLLWSIAQEAWRLNRFQRYKAGEEDVEIDSVDEQLFLTKSERHERRKRINAILRRMRKPS